ncbi:UDP-N-acetylmuramate dehydrogenase [Marinobacterium mangrovicola]|uniref:UDP-N-acetylenolpyruvoylglucosamine reductase n=1 Tax=Marinobacterium mangrovicola TaxID=1476959 RepID=A0A4V2PEG5_9GAMM|nr:UDP-N-acetylmuramate dehydrogenase [Marinobacterium mangrovicola]TCK08916.1 UDP-N-acetylmuramate dehydrogenase [Marinobacterium mangrovicola]
MSLEFHDLFSLKAMNTLGFDAVAERFVQIQSPGEVEELHAELKRSGDPLLLIGGGSNLVLAAQIPGIVAQLTIRGCEIETMDQDLVRVTLGGGENWHATVSSLLDQGIYGLENLALIPGNVGAAPVQNIGAYGVEVKDRIEAVEVYDWQEERVYWLDNQACEFGYRDSRFKREGGRYLILRVSFLLSRTPATVTTYAPLNTELSPNEQKDPRAVYRTVCRTRRDKLPDPEQIGNAGSFFKNPVVSQADYERLKAAYPGLVAYPDRAGFKLAAGWLIDHCGWKGRQMGNVGVHDRQALVLVNLGGGDRGQLERLAGAIQADVRETYGVELEPEPKFYP